MVEATTRSSVPDDPSLAKVRRLTLAELLEQPEIEQLFKQHYEELAVLKHVQVLDPMFEVYRQIEAEKRLLVLGAFRPHLVGYSVSFLTRPLHYRGLLVCQNDVLFVDWKAREVSVGNGLMEATSKEARASGAKVMLWHAKPDTRLASIGVQRRWKVQDIIYAEELV